MWLVHEVSHSRPEWNDSNRQIEGGDAMHEENPDAACVDAWLKRVAPDPVSLAPDLLLQLVDRALAAIWREAHESLGEVTLIAIATRVLFVSKERFPALSGLSIKVDGISLGALRERASPPGLHELLDPFRFLLIELLRVLGDLTANVLSPWLHAELSKVTFEEPARVDADDGSDRAHPVSPEGEKA